MAELSVQRTIVKLRTGVAGLVIPATVWVAVIICPPKLIGVDGAHV